VDADVCVVGAGYTGLWTAWALLRLDPKLHVVLVEAHAAGYGASGRNGGWLSGLMPGNRRRMAAGPGGVDGVVAFQRALIASVTSLGAVLDEEGIECDFHLGGTLSVGTTRAQMARLEADALEDLSWGWEPAEVAVLDGRAAAARVRVADGRGGVFRSACARVHPGKLVHGLASAVERKGATIYEHSPAVGVSPGVVRCHGGSVRAPWVVLATEGYTASVPGRARRLLPMNSSMIVTPPLTGDAWEKIGWEGGETLSDGAHAYVYLQRTADGRIAVGGRGVPYRYGSAAARTNRPSPPTDPSTVSGLEAALRAMFPQVQPDALRADWAWSGVLGVARDWCPSIEVHRGRRDGRSGRSGRPAGPGGMVAAGGYVGDGVTTSHLAGLTVADLVLGLDSPRTALPWVGHRCRDWEPEPLRWLGVRTVYGLYRAADRAERRRPERAGASGWARVADRLAGRSP
jgi:glycine/D-amino acid oxidase-like deaminating enzyme